MQLGTPVLDNHLHLDPVNGRGADAAAELLTSIQTEQYPELADAADNVRNAAEAIDADTELVDQDDEVLEFLTENRDAVETMDQDREAPVTLMTEATVE